MDYSNIRVLFFNSIEIPTKSDIVWGLVEIGCNVDYAQTLVAIFDARSDLVEAAEKELITCDVAVSQDFSVTLAEACHNRNVPYISWIYDSPQTALLSPAALYEQNYIFSFDKQQVKLCRSLGIKNVFYRPLAANVVYADNVSVTDDDARKYLTDISFIGQLYNVEARKRLYEKLSSDDQAYIDGIVNNKACNWNPEERVTNVLNDEFITRNKNYVTAGERPYLKEQGKILLETILLGYGIAQKERELSLSELSRHFNIDLYTKESDVDIAKDFISNGHVHGYIKDEEPYKVYYCSKINLNLSLRSIETGVPQRVFDIMSMGGVVVSNYQQEIEELFVPDKEIVVFHSMEELIDKCRFLLSHEEERKQIGINGYNAVKSQYSYAISLMDMFSKL